MTEGWVTLHSARDCHARCAATKPTWCLYRLWLIPGRSLTVPSPALVQRNFCTKPTRHTLRDRPKSAAGDEKGRGTIAHISETMTRVKPRRGGFLSFSVLLGVSGAS